MSLIRVAIAVQDARCIAMMMRAVALGETVLIRVKDTCTTKLNAANEVVDSDACTVTHPAALLKDERTEYASNLRASIGVFFDLVSLTL